MFSAQALTYDSRFLSLYQTQLFSLLPKQIESLITFHQPARVTTPDQYPPPYLSFTTVEYTSHTQDKPSWVNLHSLPPTQTGDSPICPPSYWFPSDRSETTVFWWWRWFWWHSECLCSLVITLSQVKSSLCIFKHFRDHPPKKNYSKIPEKQYLFSFKW